MEAQEERAGEGLQRGPMVSAATAEEVTGGGIKKMKQNTHNKPKIIKQTNKQTKAKQRWNPKALEIQGVGCNIETPGQESRN